MRQVVQDTDVHNFLQAAGDLLYAREAEYGLMLGQAEGLQKRPSVDFNPIFLRTTDKNGITSSAFIRTRADNGIVTHATSAELSLFSEKLAAHRFPIEGIVGPPTTSQEFAEIFAQKRNAKPKLAMAQRILELRQVIPPRPCPGNCAPASLADLDQMTQWFFDFEVEAVPHEKHDRQKSRELAERKIRGGDLYLWIVDGAKVAMNSTGRPTRSGVCVNAVFTPPALRGHGYASNLVAAVSQKMLDGGRSFCVLYTDAANQTSNKIYQSIGYQIIGESAHYLF